MPKQNHLDRAENKINPSYGLRSKTLIFACLLLGSMIACAPISKPPIGTPQLKFEAMEFSDLPGWSSDRISESLEVLKRSCQKRIILPETTSIGPNGAGGVVADWYGPCMAAERVPAGNDEATRRYFEEWFSPWQVSNNGDPIGVFTGYYEAELNGSFTQTPQFSVPILSRPSNLNDVKPYYTRAELEAGAWHGVATPLLWVDNQVDAHILHIQGSGRVKMPNGDVVRLKVAGTNGRKFTGIGGILKQEGLLTDNLSMPAVRSWLYANPQLAKELMAKNQRYIFYSLAPELSPNEGPVGAQGVPLTPLRSLAVDTTLLPLGIPVWLDTIDPDGNPLQRLMIAQDTGSAIRGAVRGDVFWGFGEKAFQIAGRMKSTGRYWFLFPKHRSAHMA